MKYFGTDGIRGIWGEDFNSELATAVGLAYGRVLSEWFETKKVRGDVQKCVLVGSDTRPSGQILKDSVCKGLMLAGFDVLDAGILPTPALLYITSAKHFAGGVMITASHNPAHYNGIKLCGVDGKKYPLAVLEKIESYIDAVDLGESAKNVQCRSVSEDLGLGREWVDALLNKVGGLNLQGLTIALDLANGAGFELIPLAFERAGAKVVAFNTQSDGKNINKNCGSLFVEKFSEVVVCNGADVGFSFDGDADRIIAVDKTGKVLDGADLMYILAVNYAGSGTSKTRTIVTTPLTNMGLETSLNELGIGLKRTKYIGSQFVQELMDEDGFSLGGEDNGHIMIKDIGVGSDGLGVGLVLLKIMQESGRTLAELSAGLKRKKVAKCDLSVSNRQWSIVGNGGLQEFLNDLHMRLGKSGRIIARSSGTERVVRVMVEGDDQPLLDELCDEICEYVKSL